MRTLLLVLALLLLCWGWLRRRASGRPVDTSPAPGRARDTSKEFHAVAIKTQPFACNAAHRLEGKRFLATEAPRLPLAACDRDRCECRFQHYSDRRAGRNRRSPFGAGGNASATGTFSQDRRHKEGRRADDE